MTIICNKTSAAGATDPQLCARRALRPKTICAKPPPTPCSSRTVSTWDSSASRQSRHENIDAERTNQSAGQHGKTKVTETTPAIGVTWNPAKTLTVFASLHHGFAPPRVEDLNNNNATFTDVDPERSTNFEPGMRAQPLSWMSVQNAYFRNVSNQSLVGVAGKRQPYAPEHT